MKAKILCYLYENRGKTVSGQEISHFLNVSRTAVWKHIRSLKEEGYPIESIPQKGYKLGSDPGTIFPCVLGKKFNTSVVYFHSIGSTNGYLKDNLYNYGDGTVVISDEQTKGRGRMGREWHSPKGKGLFLSILLKTAFQLDEIFAMNSIAAASLYRVMKNKYQIPVQIKWPNDLMVEGKKIAGILTEISGEMDGVHHLILGMGINLHNETFYHEIENLATSVYMVKNQRISRHDFTENLLEEFFSNYETFSRTRSLDFLLEDITKGSSILGKEIVVITGDRKRAAIAETITNEGFLEVRYKDGSVEMLRSGEVSIRGKSREKDN